MNLEIAVAIADTEAEGPGHRYAIWLQGCDLGCPDCCNPEMFEPGAGDAASVDELVSRIRMAPDAVEGISLLGGEPMQQAKAVLPLLRQVKELGLSTMVFSGYTLQEISKDPDRAACLQFIDILVDGRYNRKMPDTKRRWVGSRNQNMHFLSNFYTEADPQFRTGDTIEIRLRKGLLIINGNPWGPGLP